MPTRPVDDTPAVMPVPKGWQPLRLRWEPTASDNVWIARSPLGVYRLYGVPLGPGRTGSWVWSLLTSYPGSGCCLAQARDPEDAAADVELCKATAQAHFDGLSLSLFERIPLGAA